MRNALYYKAAGLRGTYIPCNLIPMTNKSRRTSINEPNPEFLGNRETWWYFGQVTK